ncbi:MAG: ComEA family DNA-binding protein [Gammaproteobacteria bacterium]|nr:ComEA family DNA-binding protein [Gammaproteobacteria bacterium]MDH5594169.1 ComEA family DNA-binding protein [Gammaproteobacteria bacterium]
MQFFRQCLLLLALLFSSTSLFAAININTADANQIADAMKGVGLSKAQAIVNYREQNGQFKTVDELSKVKGIGIRTVEKNRENLAVTDEK